MNACTCAPTRWTSFRAVETPNSSACEPRHVGPRRGSSLGIGADAALVLAVGRHEYQKGFDVLLRAVAQLRGRRPDVRLVVAGRSGGSTAELESLIRDLDLAEVVELLGVRDDVPELLCAADVFAFPSRWEGSPGAVIEAMALEVPIVASDIAPIREVGGNTECLQLVPADDASLLADAILATLGGIGNATRVAAARTQFLTRFTIDRVAEEMIAFYSRALGG